MLRLGFASFAVVSLLPGVVAPPTLASVLAKGERALVAGNAKEALRLGTAATSGYPKRYEGHRLVGRAALALDLPDRAERAFGQARKLAPAAVRPALTREIAQAGGLRKALAGIARVERLKGFGDRVGAARAQESAYLAYPARPTYGFAAAELFESADRFDDARRMLEEVERRDPKGDAAKRLAALELRAETARQAAEFEAARRAEEERRDAETARRAREGAERKRLEAEREAARQAEEERQRAEAARLAREEADRLTRLLADARTSLAQAESAVGPADGRVDDADRAVRRIDGEADDARQARDRAKRKRDDLKQRLDDAKGDLARQAIRDDLRTAERDYDSAKDDFNRVDRRLSDAKSRRDAARNEADEVRRNLQAWRQYITDNEAALARLANGG